MSTTAFDPTTRKVPPFGGFNRTVLGIELKRMLRNRRTIIFTLVFPAALFFAFGSQDGWNDEVRDGHPGNVAAYVMVSMALYGAALTAAAGGAMVAMERSLGWSRQLRLTPLNPAVYIMMKVLIALIMGAIAVTVVNLAGMAQGKPSMPAGVWVACGVLTVVCTLVFAALGVFVGYLVPGENAMQILGPGLALFSFLGNVFIPLDQASTMWHIASDLSVVELVEDHTPPAPVRSALMDALELYDDADRERLVPEPPKRLDAPDRTPFERDRARVVHAAASRRLAAKTQVVGPGTDDFVRNRLTHSLEVAQVARDLARALGCQPDIAETAALAHDLGHPPFGHNGERALEAVSADCGGFEGNAQTLRILSRLEAKTFGPEGSVGLNLTRATLDACTKYPWTRTDADDPGGVNADGSPRDIRKFGVYDDDVPVFGWLRAGVPGRRLCVEAQVMDLADDVAYSVHDIEDGIVARRIDLSRLDLDAVWQTVREWYVPSATDGVLDEVLSGLRTQAGWPAAPYDGGRRGQAALKNLTSDLIGRFCGAVQAATFASSPGPFVRHRADLVVPEQTRLEIAVLKGIAAHYVMRADDRVELMIQQRDLLTGLVDALLDRGPEVLETPFADDWKAAADDAGRSRVVIDQVASLTDASAVAWHGRLVGR